MPPNGDRSAARTYQDPEPTRCLRDPPFSWGPRGERSIYAPSHSLPLFALRLADGVVEPLPIDSRHTGSLHIRGDRLVFEQFIDLRRNIWAVELGPGGQAKTPMSRRPFIESSQGQDSPSFCPDGHSLAFASNRTGPTEIWRIDRDGGEVKKLTSLETFRAGSPAWSSDGCRIALDAAVQQENPDIYVIDAEGGEPRRVTESPAADVLPSWPAGSRWICFCSDRGGDQDIWKIPAEGGEVKRVTTGGGWESIPTPDGRYLYYSHSGETRLVIRRDLESGEETPFPQLGNAGKDRFWSPTPGGIYFLDQPGDPNWIRFLDFETGSIRQVAPYGNLAWGPRLLTVSPDGRTLLFVQLDGYNLDLMLVEGFE